MLNMVGAYTVHELRCSMERIPPRKYLASPYFLHWLDGIQRLLLEKGYVTQFAGGLFSWAEWVEVFSREIRTNPQRADEDSEAAYYRQWLAALEAILVKHAALTSDEVGEAMEHWRRSYLNTPHGNPIAFSGEWPESPELEGEDHDHHHRHEHHHPGHAGVRQPVTTSPPATARKP